MGSRGWTAGRAPRGRDNVLELAEVIEECGVLVMRSSVMGKNSHRYLKVEEFRAFTLLDGQYGLIFVNGSDSKVGQYFSLAHELGHVLLARQGVTGDKNDHVGVERWCNAVGAALILPAGELLTRWISVGNLDSVVEWAYENYGVSADTAVWMLVDRSQIMRRQAIDFLSERTQHRNAHEGDAGGGNYYRNLKSRLGSLFLSTVVDAYVDKVISQEEAAKQLGIPKTATFEKAVSSILKVA